MSIGPTISVEKRSPKAGFRWCAERLSLVFWVAVLAGTAVWGMARAQAPSSPAAQAAAQKATLELRDGWTRATPGHATTAAIYLTIVNTGKEADALTGVETGNAERAMVHVTTVTNGNAQMRMVPSLAIPASSTVTLKPGGHHIMLEGLKAPLRQGESFIITLTFAKAGKISTTVSVGSVSATGPAAEAPETPAPKPPAH